MSGSKSWMPTLVAIIALTLSGCSHEVIDVYDLCNPDDPSCDLDEDGIPNGEDAFPDDPRCSVESATNCTACGQGCPDNGYCQDAACVCHGHWLLPGCDEALGVDEVIPFASLGNPVPGATGLAIVDTWEWTPGEIHEQVLLIGSLAESQVYSIAFEELPSGYEFEAINAHPVPCCFTDLAADRTGFWLVDDIQHLRRATSESQEDLGALDCTDGVALGSTEETPVSLLCGAELQHLDADAAITQTQSLESAGTFLARNDDWVVTLTGVTATSEGPQQVLSLFHAKPEGALPLARTITMALDATSIDGLALQGHKIWFLAGGEGADAGRVHVVRVDLKEIPE
jgi:hypothetical protein